MHILRQIFDFSAIEIFCTQDVSESPVVLAVSAVGCPIRRRMSVTILPVEPYSTMAMVLKSDGRPGYRTAIIRLSWKGGGSLFFRECMSWVFLEYLCGFNSIHSGNLT